jgi:hypothetical protein
VLESIEFDGIVGSRKQEALEFKNVVEGIVSKPLGRFSIS